MKKLIFVISVIILVSCSSNNDDTGVFYPPSWIQGKWKDNVSGDVLVFSKRDILYTTSNGEVSLSKQSYKFTNSTIQVISRTSDSYILDYIEIKGGVPLRFNFLKTADTKMESKGYLRGNFIKQ
ncbi:hypothetical protein [Flavobacterium sp.]|uniref:hypothetical protein n=1 Tax=Flavobacterium sp. TaxID=239 RepID=UPI003D0CDD12